MRTPKHLILSLVFFAGCGLVKVNVNGEEHTLGGDPAPASSSSPAAEARGPAEPAPASPPAEVLAPKVALAFAEGTRPAVVEVAIPAGGRGAVPVEVLSPIKRDAFVRVFGAGATVGDGNSVSVSTRLKANNPETFKVRGAAGAKVTVVVYDAKCILEPTDVWGVPPADAAVEDRNLAAYSIFGLQRTLSGVTAAQADFAARLFQAVDPAFVLYVSDSDEAGCKLVDGEPVLLFGREYALRANGEYDRCFVTGHPAEALTTRRPAKVVMPPPGAMEGPRDGQDLWAEDWMPAKDKAAAQYLAERQKALQCYEREWKRLDPDGVAHNYDVVTYGNDGSVQKVERQTEKIDRKVEATCNLAALKRQREALRAKLTKTFDADQRERLGAVAKRFASL